MLRINAGRSDTRAASATAMRSGIGKKAAPMESNGDQKMKPATRPPNVPTEAARTMRHQRSPKRTVAIAHNGARAINGHHAGS